MTLNDPAEEIILNFLNHFAYQDAIHLSERLHSKNKTDDSLYLLALSYYRSGQKSLRVYDLLKERQLKLAKSRFLLAKCCLDLSKYGEAESVLTSNLSLKQEPSSSDAKFKLYDEIVKEYGSEHSSHVLQILANVYSKTDRSSQAVEFYKKSLRLNPFMWSSSDALCNMGEKIDFDFTFNSALNAYKGHILETDSQILTLHNVTNQLNVNKNVQKNLSPIKSPNQFGNVLKQQNDLQYLDQKCKHDISTKLRPAEQDQQTKFLNSFNNNSSTFKENAISNQTEENQSVSGGSQSSSSGMSLSTPITQPNVTNTLTVAPPQKKYMSINKPEMSCSSNRSPGANEPERNLMDIISHWKTKSRINSQYDRIKNILLSFNQKPTDFKQTDFKPADFFPPIPDSPLDSEEITSERKTQLDDKDRKSALKRKLDYENQVPRIDQIAKKIRIRKLEQENNTKKLAAPPPVQQQNNCVENFRTQQGTESSITITKRRLADIGYNNNMAPPPTPSSLLQLIKKN